MKRVSIQDLKATLSATIAEVEAGGTVVITRHRRPVAHLRPARTEAVHPGARAGAGGLRPAVRRATKGRYLTVLKEDRGGR